MALNLWNARLHEEISAVCPIIGVSIGTIGDSGSCTILFDPSATGPQQAAAAAALAAFDWTQATQDTWEQRKLLAVIGRRTAVYKTADQSTTSAGFVDVTGLSFPLAADSKYLFEFTGAYTTALVATGIAIAVNGPPSPAEISYVVEIATGIATQAAGAFASYDGATAAPTSGGSTALPFWLKGTIKTGATAGTLSLRFATEVALSAVTIKKGSIGELSAAT